MSSLPEATRNARRPALRPDAAEYTLEQKTDVAVTVRWLPSAPVPWWLWWNVLSLDAPTVACVWFLLLLRASGLHPPFTGIAALALAVWLIYTADRLLDGFAFRPGSSPQTRHFFCARHRLVLTSLIVAVGAALLWISMLYLEAAVVRAGLFLGAIVVLYLASIHAGSARSSRIIPKEIAVGAIFAAGTSIPLWSQPEPVLPGTMVTVPLFALLCSLNCLAIECWERPRNAREPRELAPSWVAWAELHLGGMALGVATASLLAGLLSGSGGASRIPLFAISLAAFLTLTLNAQRERLSPEALRVLADAALALPALAALALLH